MKLTIQIIFLMVILAACSHKEQKTEVGQYVYVDWFNTIHIDRECASKMVENPKTKEERMWKMRGVSFIDTCDLTDGYRRKYSDMFDTYDFCPRCVDDLAYTHLTAIMERNKN